MALRAQKMAERRERILASAREMIAEEGFEALTTRALADRARVTVPTIYNLIGAKDAVLFAAVEDQTARFLEAIGGQRAEQPIDRVLSVSEQCVAELNRVPRYYRALLRLMVASDSAAAVRRSVGRTVRQEFLYGLEALRDSGQIDDGLPLTTIAERLATHLTATATQWATGDIDGSNLHRSATVGTGLLLLGVTRGPAHERMAALLRDHARTSFRDADPTAASTCPSGGGRKQA